MNREIYQEPLVSRYTSRKMQEIFSERTRILTWRRCWIALAEAQNELGLSETVTQEMINELKDQLENIDFEMAFDSVSVTPIFSSTCKSSQRVSFSR